MPRLLRSSTKNWLQAAGDSVLDAALVSFYSATIPGRFTWSAYMYFD